MHCLDTQQAQSIDWEAPWLAHLGTRIDVGAPQNWASNADMRGALNQAVEYLRAQGLPMRTGLNQSLHFIVQEDLPAHQSYEAHIALTGGVPTRLNLHDFFNACVWLTFPLIKAVLNARQYEQIQAMGVQHERGMARDALTLFDENAAILVTSNPNIARALREFDWHNALVAVRDVWAQFNHPKQNEQAQLYVFGHALMDKLTAPRKSMCAHTWVLQVEPSWFEQSTLERIQSIDEQLAHTFKTHTFHTRDYCPLPVLGAPHFWQDNIEPSFYNDTQVFRAGRMRELNAVTSTKTTSPNQR